MGLSLIFSLTMLWPFLLLVFTCVCSAVWQPAPGTSWQWQISGNYINKNYNVAMYDVDLYETSAADFNALKAAGRIVICYFSAGTIEDFRSDAGDFPAATVGTALPEWPGEKWVDIRSPAVRQIMINRLDYAQARNCDGVEPDNVDGYANVNGLGLQDFDQLDYNIWIAAEAHSRNLSVGLKNDVAQLSQLESHFDWALNEECLAYNECAEYSVFLLQNKAVFHTEYLDDHSEWTYAKKQEICNTPSRPAGFSTIVKDWDVTAWRRAC